MNFSRQKWRCLLVACLLAFTAIAQAQVTAGDAVQNLPITKQLNTSSPLSSSNDFGDRLTIVDFFGTWCVPCLRALPHLTSLQQEFKNSLNIVLVSNETEAQLAKFIKARPNFSFAVIVDEGNRWNSAFQPPALPYTVVLKNGKVVSVTEAAAITTEKINEWLTTQTAATMVNENRVQKTTSQPATVSSLQQSKNNLVRLSQDYIYAAKTDASVTTLTQNLASLSLEELKTSLSSDKEKKAFWINLYNGYTQAALKENAGQYQNRSAFFKKKRIHVGGERLSLDDIEHGILRRSKIKWSLGHLNKLFPSKTERALRVDRLDYRLHFALNCGAKSCPPIAFYNNETLDAQLDLATKSYLASEAEFDSGANVIRLPKLMSWFRADFGGKKGMLKILRQHGIIPGNAKPKIKFKDYDWTVTLNNYTTSNP